MIRIAAVYARKDGKRFDIEYYIHTHLPIVEKKFGPYGLSRIEVDRPLQAPSGNESPFFAVGYLYFPTLRDFQDAYANAGAEVTADWVKYTDVKPMIQVGEIC